MNKLITSILTAFVLACSAMQAQIVPVSLEECLKLGLENDAAIRNTRLDLAAAREQRSEARWEYLPRISATTFGYWSVHPLLKVTVKDVIGNSDAANEINNRIQEYAQDNGLKTVYTALKQGFGASATVFQPVYAGGRIVNGNRLATLGVEAASLQSRIKERQEASGIERKYWSVVALQEKMNTLIQAQSLLDTLARDAGAAFAAGLLTSADVRPVRERQDELKAAAVKLRGGLRLAKMDLFNAVGYRYSMLGLDSLVLSDSLDSLMAPSVYIIPDGQAVRSDESVLLGIQVQARELERKMSVGESLPQLMVGASCSYSNMMGNDVMRSNAVGFVSLQIPITDLGKAAHRARRLEYEVQKARNDRDYLDAQLLLRRRMMQLEMETAWDALEIAKSRESDARNDALTAEAEYRSGRGTLSDWLRAELDLRTALEDGISRCIEYRNAVRAYLYVL